MSKPIKPMDDFWKQMLDELDNTTNEEWMQLMWDMNDKIEEDYDIALNDELTVDQDQELEERLQQTLYQFLKEHKLDKRIWTVFDSVEYKPEDFGIDLSDF